MGKKVYLTLLVTLLGISNLYAEKRFTIYSLPKDEQESESILSSINPKLYEETKFDKFSSSKVFEIAGIGVPFIIGGLAVKPEDNRFTEYTKDYPRTFETYFDDYTQYAPLAAKYIMKIAGVKGCSSWGRMVVSDVFSVVLMAGCVEIMKRTIDMPRPDESENTSFPSGHTATAFMAATLLNKEYGYLSPWIPVVSYTLASSTAMGRQLNSRHWVSDLMVGAGIGVISAELGYYFADLIFKDKGLYRKSEKPAWEYGRKPHFFSTMVGVSTVLGDYKSVTGESIDIKAGNRVGFEGAYFPHTNVGVGGRLTVSNNMFAVNGNILEGWLGTLSLYGGAYYDYQLSSRWNIAGKTLAGYNFYSGWSSWIENGIPENDGSFGGVAGVSFGFLATKNLRFSLGCDYSFMSSARLEPDKFQHELMFGGGTSVIF